VAETNILNTLGAGSGLDVSAMVDALVNAERAPKETQINSKISQSEATISGLGILSSAMKTLSDAYQRLDDLSEFTDQASVTASTVAFSVEAGSGPVPGQYSTSVQQLASSQVERLFVGYDGNGDPVGFNGASENLNGGNAFGIDLTIGGTTTTVNVTDTTPQGIADAINAAGLSVSARIVDTGAATGNIQIVLTGDEGASNQFTVSTAVAARETLRTAADAILTVDGVQMTRPSNKITDAIPGVDLELFVPTTSAVTVNVARDTAAVKTAIEDMVNAYNAFLGVTDALKDRENQSDDGTGSLAGNSALRTIMTQIRRMMTSVSSTPGENVTVLADLGIQFELGGQMTVDGTKLQAKLDGSFDDVATFFSANTNRQTTTGVASRGLAGDMVKYLADQTSSTGVIKSQEDTLKQSRGRYEAQLEALDLRMEQIRARYVTQFTAMEQAVDQFNSLRESLTTQFENMPFTNKNN